MDVTDIDLHRPTQAWFQKTEMESEVITEKRNSSERVQIQEIEICDSCSENGRV